MITELGDQAMHPTRGQGAMEVSSELGWNRQFVLDKVLCLYSDRQSYFATVHQPIARSSGPPQLGPGELLCEEQLASMVQALGATLRAEVLPPFVLCRTLARTAWWVGPKVRPMFWSHTKLQAISGRKVPTPGLVFRLTGSHLAVFAVKGQDRPTAETWLYRAPFGNTYENGNVCQGSMPAPRANSVAVLPDWERAYFGSNFTASAHGVACVKGGLEAFWPEVLDWPSFPEEKLIPAKLTLQQFVEGKEDPRWAGL